VSDNGAPKIRPVRRRYYDLFSYIYDGFIRLHARDDESDTRQFLMNSAGLEYKSSPRILDVCCGTGSVVLNFVRRYENCMAVGYDFSHGMLRRAYEKAAGYQVDFVEGDAAELPFPDDSFNVVVCSHALYELKGCAREAALLEMKRLIKPGGRILIMEHEVPRQKFLRMLFKIRMLFAGGADGGTIDTGMDQFRNIFPKVLRTHSESGKSILVSCSK
jgi:ubiquinone/menaquinone biosynthesis C-methylase UbiE